MGYRIAFAGFMLESVTAVPVISTKISPRSPASSP